MNKLFTKIAALALGATMAVGVGVAVGTSSKEATQVQATSDTATYNLVTSTSGLETGKNYVITNSKTAGSVNAMSTAVQQKYRQYTSVTVASGGTSLTANASTLRLTLSGSSGSWIFTTDNYGGTDGRLRPASGKSNELYVDASATSTATISFSSDAAVITLSGNSDSRGIIRWNGTSGQERFACYKSGQSPIYLWKEVASIPTTSVEVSPATVTLAPNETQQLTTTVLPANTTDTLTYSSSATGVATVSSSGLITAVADGTATITATSGNYSDTCVVTVETPTTPFITPEKTSTSGYTGCNETIGFVYGNLTSLGVSTSGATVSASIENNDGDSADVVITFNTATASESYVYLKDGSTTLATITVTSITASTVTITGLPSEATCYSNETLDLNSKINVVATGSMTSDVSWKSDNEDVATVSAGVVTPVALGAANITVTSDDYPSATMTCKVTVEPAPQKYVIDGPDNDNASAALTLANLKTYYPTTNMEVEWTAVSGSIFGSSTQAIRVGTGSATGSATLSLIDNASIYVTKIVVSVKNYGTDSSTFVVNGDVTTNTAKSATSTAADYEFSFASTDTTFTIQNVSKRIYVYRVDVYYSYKTAELSASPSSFDLAVSTSQDVTLIPKNFTPSSYKATVKSGTSLTAGSVEFSGNIATITAGVSTGITVLTITGTEGLRTASVDITVDVTQPRNLITLTITTPSDATTFKVGQTFDVGSLVITGTFDSAPTTVVYSKAQGNMALLTALPEIGYTFVESDMETITSAEFELTVGTGTKSVSYPINVIDKDYAGAATSIDDLWDGQHVYFSNGTNAAFPKYSTGKNITSVDATIDETKGLDIGSTTAFAYTVGRVKIESTVYYTFSFDDDGDTYYIKDAGTSSDNAISKTTDTTDTTIYWTISAGAKTGQWHIVNRSNDIKPTLQVNGAYLSCYNDNQTDPYLYVVTPYSEQTVADAFVERYLHMDEEVSGQCNTYYPILKPVWAAMTGLEKAGVSGAAYERLKAWAAAHGEHLDSDMNIVSNSKIALLDTMSESSNDILIVVIISVISLTAIGGFVFLKKRREQN